MTTPTIPLSVSRVSCSDFVMAILFAQLTSERVRNATTSADKLPSDARYYLAEDRMSGYGINDEDELIAVFSLVKGRGRSLVESAIQNGARRLDCFDGFLPEFYAGFGFVEVDRARNWTQGGPDVVWMYLPAQQAAA